MKRAVLLLISSLILLLVNINLIRQTVRVLRTNERIEAVKARVLGLRDANEKFKRDLQYYASDAFVERESREKLGRGLPGDILVYLPEEQRERTHVERVVANEANWKKWWRLFFGE